MTKKKLNKEPRVIPAGTQQETGVSRFIKKKKLTDKIGIIKDAKANNEMELTDNDISKQEPDTLKDKPKFRPSMDNADQPLPD